MCKCLSYISKAALTNGSNLSYNKVELDLLELFVRNKFERLFEDEGVSTRVWIHGETRKEGIQVFHGEAE